MRTFTFFAAAAALLPGVLAVDQIKSAIVWFEDNATPDFVVEKAKAVIKKAGGDITHEYNFIKGFSVTAPAAALEVMHTWGKDYDVKIEEDQVVTVS